MSATGRRHRGDRPAHVGFRRMEEHDLGTVAQWLSEDHVQQWWRDPTAPQRARAKYLPRIRGEEPTEMFIVVVEGEEVGFVQRYRLADHPSWHAAIAGAGLTFPAGAGIDYCIGRPDFTNLGIGSAMIPAFTSQVFDAYPDVDCIAVAPQAANTASRRVLEKAGYELVWSGMLDSDDPGDADRAALYVRAR